MDTWRGVGGGWNHNGGKKTELRISSFSKRKEKLRKVIMDLSQQEYQLWEEGNSADGEDKWYRSCS